MIKKLRNELNITQKELAKRVGISKSYLNKLENNNFNKTTVNIQVVKNLCRVLGICVHILLKEWYGDDFLCYKSKFKCPFCNICKQFWLLHKFVYFYFIIHLRWIICLGID